MIDREMSTSIPNLIPINSALLIKDWALEFIQFSLRKIFKNLIALMLSMLN